MVAGTTRDSIYIPFERNEEKYTLIDTAGISPQYLSEIERGLKEPSSEMIAAVGGALDVTLVDLTLAVAEATRGTVAPAVGARVLALAA